MAQRVNRKELIALNCGKEPFHLHYAKLKGGINGQIRSANALNQTKQVMQASRQWPGPLCHDTLMRTSPACGGSTITVVKSSGLLASHAMAAWHSMG